MTDDRDARYTWFPGDVVPVANIVPLTSAQRSAVEIYVTDPAHECSSFRLLPDGLELLVDADTACRELTEAANSAPWLEGAAALTNLVRKIRQR